MKIYVTDDFDDFMVKAQLDDKIVLKVANELNNGLHDGDLDMGRLFKKRIPSPRQSKRDSNRSVVAIRKDNLLFLLMAGARQMFQRKVKRSPISYWKHTDYWVIASLILQINRSGKT
ncbi:RelE toxin of RelE / RelB toxin-antitoxin system [Amphritea atlantica]|uniref:RelE toxin of RelE / RelB toxin-antitoxin system n=1 Tax=Amphritea atlantica TaxID=355243 RepID=A0A1H9ILL6_9GAMM|nr:type II toxin-antitoxin system RelE/ParE family toxin [Amphritea atlantica]SEQ75490.1 RelE toxin of RelE / RelB toxin-antitoxin system [Amphritea atlantica]